MEPIERIRPALADRYQVLQQIGAGGMATVYRARDIRHERDVALKLLRPELGTVLGPERFLSEIRVTARLQHPHLLPLFDSGGDPAAVEDQPSAGAGGQSRALDRPEP